MKLEKGLAFLCATLLGAALPLGGIFCLATGFSLTNYSVLLLTLLFLGLSAFVAAVALSNSYRKRRILLVGVALVGIAAHICAGNWLPYLFTDVTSTYHTAYGFPIFPNRVYTPDMLERGTLTWALFFLSIPGCAVTTLTLCRRWRCLGAVGLSLLPVAACVVVTDTVPASWALYLFLAGLMLLLLTQSVRRREEKAGARLVALLLVPCLLCPWLLLSAIPQEGYQVPTSSLFQSAVQWLQEHFSLGNNGSNQGGVAALEMEIDLTEVGPQYQTANKALTLTSTYTDLIYLRGQSYDTYVGNGWKQTTLTPERNGWNKVGLRQIGELTIETQRTLPFRYFSYYHSQARLEFPYTGGCLTNEGLSTTYTVTVRQPTKQFDLYESQRLTEDQYRRYTALPTSTATWAVPLVEQLEAQDAQSITAFVSDLVPYALSTPAMPEGQWDFAQWFYEDAPSGYCVHYATLATVLLRAAGIPARYVTGYVVYAQADTPVTVTSDNAHAWVEYYTDKTGWQPLDPTPSAGLPMPPSSTEPSEPTQPTTNTTAPTTDTTGTTPTTTGSDTSRPTAGTQPDGTTSQLPTLPSLTRPNRTDTPQTPLDLTWLFTLLKILGILAVIVLAVLGQYILRLRHRRRKCHTGPANSQALARWREVLQLCWLLMLPEPENLLALAEKARFSQHTLTRAELGQFDTWLTQTRQSLRLRHLLLRLILAL